MLLHGAELGEHRVPIAWGGVCGPLSHWTHRSVLTWVRRQVRGLAARLGAQRVFCALAAALEQEADLRFAATLVQALNLLLLTVPEVRRGTAP